MSAPGPLLERRLVIVTGKGGTGKTTVAAALALAAAGTGRRVLLADLAPDEALAPLLAPGGPPVGYAGRSVAPNLRLQRIDPFEALTEYLGLQLRTPGLVRRVLRNPGFRQLMNASPGWRELITLGKVWHLGEMRDDAGGPRYDLLVVDAPATGHGVAFLNVPRVVVSAVRAGPLRRHTEAVETMLEDPRHTLVLPVALAEDLPTRETGELVTAVRDGLGVAIDRVVINRVLPPPFPAGLDRLDEHLAVLPDDARFGTLPRAGALARCAAFLRARYALNRHYALELTERTGLPAVHLPFLPDGAGDPDALETLGRALLAAPTADA